MTVESSNSEFSILNFPREHGKRFGDVKYRIEKDKTVWRMMYEDGGWYKDFPVFDLEKIREEDEREAIKQFLF